MCEICQPFPCSVMTSIDVTDTVIIISGFERELMFRVDQVTTSHRGVDLQMGVILYLAFLKLQASGHP